MNPENKDSLNACRFVRENKRGHYESYFQRANHPDRPLAFWVRYTVFSPKGHPENAIGELWAIYFDGESDRITAVKDEIPISQCQFSPSGLDVRIGKATLTEGKLEGLASTGPHTLEWSLAYGGKDRPLLLLPQAVYERGLPRAKALVGTPNATYEGSLQVDGEPVAVEGWVGSQNHNWGSRHTDEYAWGQVAGFDDAPEAFLECATSRVRLGPLWSPWLTLMVLRIGGQEFDLNSITQAVRAHGHYEFFTWELDSQTPRVRISARIQAPKSEFVGLWYSNPPGGRKICLNTKLASCELTLDRPGQRPRLLRTRHRAAFEILTDRPDHGVPMAV